MNNASMNKGMTFFAQEGRDTVVYTADTVAQSGRLMAKLFTSPVHVVEFKFVDSDSAPSREKQMAMYLRRLNKVAAIAGRCVTRVDVRGVVATAQVAA